MNMFSISSSDWLVTALLAFVAAYGYAIALWPLLTGSRRLGVLGSAVAALGTFAVPLLIPSDNIFLRTLSVFLCTELTLKMIDYSRHCRRNGGSTFREYLQFLIPFPVLLVNFRQQADRRLVIAPLKEVSRVLGGIVGFVTSLLLVLRVAEFAVVRSSFAIDHTIKMVLFVIAVESLSLALFGLERLTGFRTRPLIEQAYLSQTVGEFWLRYNTRIHTWLDQNVFRPAGGVHFPIRSISLAFLVSAIIHELAFGIATSRFDGYQFSFFMMQAPASLLSSQIKQLTRSWGLVGKVISHLATICWFWASTIFFLHGVNRIFPFVYVSQPWLP